MTQPQTGPGILSWYPPAPIESRTGGPHAPLNCCSERDRLLDRFESALRRYADRSLKLARGMCAQDRDRRAEQCEDARLLCDHICGELSQHTAEHQCGDVQL